MQLQLFSFCVGWKMMSYDVFKALSHTQIHSNDENQCHQLTSKFPQQTAMRYGYGVLLNKSDCVSFSNGFGYTCDGDHKFHSNYGRKAVETIVIMRTKMTQCWIYHIQSDYKAYGQP